MDRQRHKLIGTSIASSASFVAPTEAKDDFPVSVPQNAKQKRNATRHAVLKATNQYKPNGKREVARRLAKMSEAA